MTITVQRHTISRQLLPRREPSIPKHTAQLLARIEDSPFALESVMSTALVTAYERTSVDPDVSWVESWEAWVTAMQAGSAIFAAATATEANVQCLIHHEKRTVSAFTQSETFVDVGHWVTAFYLAVICRNGQRLTVLCQIPIAKLRESGAVYNKYHYAWIETLQAFWLGREDFSDELVEAASGTQPGSMSTTDQDYVSRITWPPMDLLRWRATGQHDEFNRALEEALRAHKDYWSADQERADSCYGWVALAPLAMACFALDAGFPIEVDSDYLPKHLLKATWAGEFPTRINPWRRCSHHGREPRGCRTPD
ncbi:immunity 49 family protein [Streptomyces sp. C11-1]|uniref:Immunity 49 family protein n=1 Tax=Streptomyces durocortorensis TaxID=2811104 RepID=A0ABY9VUB6_9ACTN|nr:immunity 49 family protein [Streptomyces durocortorensis]WNF27165.1 immunity 49 family protein [Streptomyces durocortorensis]